MKRKVIQFFVLLIIFVALLGALHVVKFGGITGFAVFEDSSQCDFGFGTYTNTTFNGSAVVLQGENLSGIFRSQVFDSADENSLWNNLSFVGQNGNSELLFLVDGTADVWKSGDFGTTWELTKDDYNGGIVNGATYMSRNSSGSVFILHNQDLWESNDKGVNWELTNDDFNGAGDTGNGKVLDIDSSDNLYVLEGSEDVYQSEDSGVSFSLLVSDFNGANGDIFGIAVNSTDGIFAVDGAADVWQSVDLGTTWSLVKDDYNGGNTNAATDMAIDSSDALYILHNQDLWKSTDSGVTWSLANDDFNGAGDSNSGQVIYVDASDNIYIIDGSEDLFNSSDSGTTFSLSASDLNGASGNVFGLTSGVYSTTLSFRARNCSLSDCSDGSFGSLLSGSVESLNLTGRYFQYEFLFESPSLSITPVLESVLVDYNVLVDDVNPAVSLVYPTSTEYTVSQTELNYLSSDSNLQACWYSLDSGETNVSVTCGSNITGLNSGEGSFTWIVYANDTSGNSNSSNVSFSVSIPTPGTGGGGGGGGGGSSSGGSIVITPSNKTKEVKVVFSEFERVVIKKGTSEEINVEVKSNDLKFLNNCGLKGDGVFESWISNGQSEGLSKGEKFVYVVELNVPEDVEVGSYVEDLIVECDEGEARTGFEITVFRNSFEAKVLEYEKIDNSLKLTYLLEEYAQQDHEIVLSYALIDFDGVERAVGQEGLVLGPGFSGEQILEFGLPKDSFGEFVLVLQLNDGLTSSITREDIFLPSRAGGTVGFVISEENRQRLSIAGIVVVSLIVVFFVFRFAYIHYKRRRGGTRLGLGKRFKRRFLRFELA